MVFVQSYLTRFLFAALVLTWLLCMSGIGIYLSKNHLTKNGELWDGLSIGFVTKCDTSNTYSPMQDVVDSCRIGVATIMIYCLIWEYKPATLQFMLLLSIFWLVLALMQFLA